MWWSRGIDADQAARAGERLARLTSSRAATRTAPAAREPAGGWIPGPPAPVAVPAPVQALLPVQAAEASVLPAAPRVLRLDTGRRGVGVLVVVAIVAALLGGWYLWRSRPVAEAVPPAITGGDGSAATASGTPAPKLIVVDVVGKVAKPGLVRVPDGSRVADAIAAAGGASPGANLNGLNLARKLRDGEQVGVGVPGAPAGGGDAAGDSSAGPVDLNTATAAQLATLPGIGEVLAQRIVDWRTAHGGFHAVTDLRSVAGIGDRTFAELKAKVRV